MPLEIFCDSCGVSLYSGFDLKSPVELLKNSDGKCSKCGHKLSIKDFSVDIINIE